MIRGFDVSRYQAGIDMAAARQAGMHFVFVRASIGAEADWACGEHLRNARGLLARGTYHALLPEVPPAVQAVTYYAALAASGGFLVELPPVVDVEKAGLDEMMVRQFLYEMEHLWHCRPLIYTSESKWHALVGHDRNLRLELRMRRDRSRLRQHHRGAPAAHPLGRVDLLAIHRGRGAVLAAQDRSGPV